MLESSITMPIWVGLGPHPLLHGVAKNVEFFVCFFIPQACDKIASDMVHRAISLQ